MLWWRRCGSLGWSGFSGFPATRSTGSPTRCAGTVASRGSTSGTRRRRPSRRPAEAALTGELAVCVGSCGPGNLHLINGLFDANRSGVPVLAIAAHIPREEIGGGYFQETHPQELFRECSVYCELVSVPEQLPRMLEIAMRAALERARRRRRRRPGRDLPARRRLGRSAPIRCGRIVGHPARDERSLAAAADVLNAARRGHDPRRRGLRGRPRRAHRDRGGAQGPRRPRDARQGVRRVRQPLRRRHDRPARIQLRATGRWSTATPC